jgi:nicotinate-nucleotide pyrophosphorylase (carboxylating)
MIELVRLALEEDIGSGDVTSRFSVPESRDANGCFLARQDLIVAGLEVLEEIYPEGLELR